jgi:uncharacterized protein YkwD
MRPICFTIFLLITLPSFAQAATQPGDVDLGKVTQQIIDRTNAFRREQGLAPVAVETKLTATAADFAKFMADTGKYGHDADGKQPHERAEAHKYDYCMVLENIAYQFNSEGIPQEDLISFFVEGWKNSPGHRKNMLDVDITQTGVAVVRAANGYYYAVQMFGRPKSAMIRFEIINNTDLSFEYSIGDEKYTIQGKQIRSYAICRASKIIIVLPGEREAKTLTPVNGDRFNFRRVQGNKFDLVRAK